MNEPSSPVEDCRCDTLHGASGDLLLLGTYGDFLPHLSCEKAHPQFLHSHVPSVITVGRLGVSSVLEKEVVPT